jgi:hypothetical protein
LTRAIRSPLLAPRRSPAGSCDLRRETPIDLLTHNEVNSMLKLVKPAKFKGSSVSGTLGPKSKFIILVICDVVTYTSFLNYFRRHTSDQSSPSIFESLRSSLRVPKNSTSERLCRTNPCTPQGQSVEDDMGQKQFLQRGYPIMIGLLLALGTPAGQARPQSETICCDQSTAQNAAPALDQRALDLLAETRDRLATADMLAFKAVVTDERLNLPEPPVSQSGDCGPGVVVPASTAPSIYRATSDVLMKRPDKLRVITSGAGPFTEFYYDGRMITEFSPSTNFATAATAPPTIDEALSTIHNSSRIHFPFSDILRTGRCDDRGECFESAAYLGQARAFDGTTTDLIAYTLNGVFVQLWIGVEDKLPRMLLAVFRDDPLQLRYQMEFSNWQIDQPVSLQAFDVNNEIIAAQEPILPIEAGLPMMNAPMIPAR